MPRDVAALARYNRLSASANAMANAHVMMVMLLDVANGMVRPSEGGKRRDQRGAADQRGQTESGLERGFHVFGLETSAFYG
jgi:hypothetical protein